FGDKTPNSGVAEPVTRASTPARAAAPAPAPVRASASSAADAAAPAILRLIPRGELIGDADLASNPVFESQNWNPPAPKAPPPPPPPPPTAPPLPFTFVGKAQSEGAVEVYLARGDKLYLVKAKDVIDGTYRVDTIKPPMMTLTYLPMNQ